MNLFKSVILGAFAYALVAAIRPMLMGLSASLILTQFFVPDIALFTFVAVLFLALGFRGIRLVGAVIIVTPLLAVLGPVSLNLISLGAADYFTSWDFRIAGGIAVFSLVGSMIGSWVLVKLSGKSRDAEA